MSSLPQLPPGFSITGGIPTKSQDLAASVIFIIAYACLIPLTAWRLASKASRSRTLIRPAIFVLVRTATYVIRALQSNGNYSQTLFIVEQVLLLAGFPIICEALLSFLEYHITRTHTSPEQGQTTQRVCRLLKLALIAALVLGVIAGTQTSNAINDPSKASQIRTLRNANAALCLAIVLGIIVVVLIAQCHKNLPIQPTVLLVFMAGCLAVAGAYRLALIHTSSPPLAMSTKVKFYVLLGLMEWAVTFSLFVVNARVVFAEDLAREKKKAAKGGRYEETPMRGYRDPYERA
ncbi:hypothetical protein ACGC1H_003463 [Rhizoctonia solani]|uniref:DUF7702 domain-containing protein n=1 Tax=Rhizoctonia solani TaxID=456999 RepID=A0A8H3CKG8_9AGAM|nr:unnamed protein product [Rhizoctonia solani]